MAEVITYRHLVPPSILVGSVVIAFCLDPRHGWRHLLGAVPGANTASGPLLVLFYLLAAGTLLLALGFMIGACGAFILRSIGFIPGMPRGLSMFWRKNTHEELLILYTFPDGRFDSRYAEMAEQCFLMEAASPHLYEWLRGRWEYYFINYNSVVALLAAAILTCSAHFHPGWKWFIGVLGFTVVFGVNAWQAHLECTDMDHFLFANWTRIKARRGMPLGI